MLNVLSLKQIELATEEDKFWELDRWAALFSAKTWRDIKMIAKNNEVDTLILGAYGCGVFGQDPYEVASIFKEYLDECKCFKTVVFAVPNGKNGNYEAFIKTFEGK